MKKFRIVILLTLILTLLVSASVWEGAGSASAAREFPETGYYVATNSFPRNTVVEITNLENGRTVRTVVAKSLDTPGLLVTLSPSAADAIGISPGAIARILMNQVSEPLGSSALDMSEEPGLARAPEVTPVPSVPAAPATPSAEASGPPASGMADTMTESITDSKAESAVEPLPEAAGEEAVIAAVTAVPPTVAAVETPSTPPAASTPKTASPDAAEANETAAEAGGATADVTGSMAESKVDSKTEPSPGTGDSLAVSRPPERIAAAEASGGPVEHETYDYILEPSAPLIPVTPDPVINPEDIAGASVAPPERDYIDPFYIIPSAGEVTPAVPSASPSASPSAIPVTIPPEAVIPAIAPAATSPVRFSVPVILGLEKGRYYIQVAAFSKPESIESEIRKIDSGLPMAVQPIDGVEKPVYRLLVGPVNLGESGALLQRFKATYKDAFVKLGT